VKNTQKNVSTSPANTIIALKKRKPRANSILQNTVHCIFYKNILHDCVIFGELSMVRQHHAVYNVTQHLLFSTLKSGTGPAEIVLYPTTADTAFYMLFDLLQAPEKPDPGPFLDSSATEVQP
jgi:hypothetical protein